MTAKTRLYSFAAAVWAGFYIYLFIATSHRHDNGAVAWWYVALVAAPLVLTLAAGVEGATDRASRALLAALVLFVFGGLIQVKGLGLFLVPAIIATAIAAGAVGRQPAAR